MPRQLGGRMAAATLPQRPFRDTGTGLQCDSPRPLLELARAPARQVRPALPGSNSPGRGLGRPGRRLRDPGHARERLFALPGPAFAAPTAGRETNQPEPALRRTAVGRDHRLLALRGLLWPARAEPRR